MQIVMTRPGRYLRARCFGLLALVSVSCMASEAVVIAPGIISTAAVEYGAVVDPLDGTLYFVRTDAPWGSPACGRILASRQDAQGWAEPVSALAGDGICYGDPFISADGQQFLFTSTAHEGGARKDDDIWSMWRTEDGWGRPARLDTVNSTAREFSPVLTRSGTLYFASDRPGGSGAGDIWFAQRAGKDFAAPRNLGPVVNSAHGEWSVHVDPGETYLIFESSGRPGAKSTAGDLYLSRRGESAWSRPVPVISLNTGGSELMPRPSRDGSRFYFTRTGSSGNADILSVDAGVVLADPAGSPAHAGKIAGSATAGDSRKPEESKGRKSGACLQRRIRPDAGLSAAVDRVVDGARKDGFAGQVAIARNGRLVYSRAVGFSDAGGKVAVTRQTGFQVSSLVKYFTASLVMLALDEGRLDTADGVASLAPGTRIAGRGTTFDQLLSHRSGLGSSYAAEGIANRDLALRAIDEVPFDVGRMGEFHYSNDGFDVLAILLERLYRQPFEVVVREKLLKPACIEHAAFWSEVDPRDPRRVGQPVEPVAEELLSRNYGFLGSQGLLINADDLVAFQAALRSGSVLSKESYGKLTEPRSETSIGQAAYGAFVRQDAQTGRRIAALGSEDWGDNAILADYVDCGWLVAITTSKGPVGVKGDQLFRSRISAGIERYIAGRCKDVPAGSPAGPFAAGLLP